jgi:hypothetical protein
MYLWRGLPEGQLLAVLRWIGTRRDRPTNPVQNPADAAPIQPVIEPADKTR